MEKILSHKTVSLTELRDPAKALLKAGDSPVAVLNRNHYGIINDEYDLAATYAVVIATGYVFNDANKRTSFITMDACLRKNGIIMEFDSKAIGQIIIKIAQGVMDEIELARYLRVLR